MCFQDSTGQVTVIQTPTVRHVQNGQTAVLTCKTSSSIGRQSDGAWMHFQDSTGQGCREMTILPPALMGNIVLTMTRTSFCSRIQWSHV
ncbi:hypothetical protein QQF64_023229, partial [Cirrhinus molitorella]